MQLELYIEINKTIINMYKFQFSDYRYHWCDRIKYLLNNYPCCYRQWHLLSYLVHKDSFPNSVNLRNQETIRNESAFGQFVARAPV